MLEYEIIKSK